MSDPQTPPASPEPAEPMDAAPAAPEATPVEAAPVEAAPVEAAPAPVPAAQTPSAGVTPVAAPTAVVAEAPAVPAVPAKKKRRALGVTALVFALLAVVIDIGTLIFGFASMSQFGDGNYGRAFGLLAGFFGYGLVAVVVGAIFAGIAFVLSIGAMIGGSGRAPGVIAFLLSIGELVLHGIAIAAIIGLVTTAATAIGGLTGVGGIDTMPLDQLIPGLDQLLPTPSA